KDAASIAYQVPKPSDADTDEEPATPHHHGGEGGALDSEPRERTDAADEQRVEAHRQHYRGHEQKEWRARVARGTERRLDREEAEHQRSAQEPGVQVRA